MTSLSAVTALSMQTMKLGPPLSAAIPSSLPVSSPWNGGGGIGWIGGGISLIAARPRRHHPLRSRSFRCLSALSPEMRNSLEKVVRSEKVVLFMKGTKDFPQCGFSNTVVQILKSLNVPFEALNVLENEALRQALKEYSSWPTFPQLYIDGDFFGGCDITLEAYKSGQLQEVLEKAMCS